MAPSPQVERWRRGQVPYLERVAGANLKKLGTALRIFARWADSCSLLVPSCRARLFTSPGRRTDIRFALASPAIQTSSVYIEPIGCRRRFRNGRHRTNRQGSEQRSMPWNEGGLIVRAPRPRSPTTRGHHLDRFRTGHGNASSKGRPRSGRWPMVNQIDLDGGRSWVRPRRGQETITDQAAETKGQVTEEPTPGLEPGTCRLHGSVCSPLPVSARHPLPRWVMPR